MRIKEASPQAYTFLQSRANSNSPQQLYIHPVKSLRPIALSSAVLTPTGIPYDRRYMLLKHSSSASDPSKRLERMTVTYFAELGLFTQSLSESEDGKFVVTYNAPLGAGKERTHLEMAFEPNTEGLEEMEVDLHGSKTKALNMGMEINGWFSDCFGWDVVCVYLPEGNTRQVLGNLSPNAVSDSNNPANNRSWFSTFTSYVPDYLMGKQEEEERITFADCAPYLVITMESFDDVSSRMPDGAEIDITKFRPNIVLEGADVAYEEDYWGAISIFPSHDANVNTAETEGHGVEMLLTQNCIRCQSLDMDYTTGTYSKSEAGMVLKKLMKDRRVDAGKRYSPVFGRYGFLAGKGGEKGGTVRVGDEVRVSKKNEERTKFCMFVPKTSADEFGADLWPDWPGLM
ncbi:MAG: hypothetical protein LQ338_002066 [Usnochroma carphineum]|nr:MAG: hypothetical protein LQ338_002066 [Usnochroma carphineum]